MIRLSSYSSRSRSISLLVFSLVCIIHLLRADGPGKSSVAVIGAGIGGSAASYFLREALGEEVEIMVFDSASKAGGRTDVSSYQYHSSVSYDQMLLLLCCGWGQGSTYL